MKQGENRWLKMYSAQRLRMKLCRASSGKARSRTFAADLSASFPVAGSSAVVIASRDLLKKSPEEWEVVAEHEMFHVFRPQNGSEAKVAALDIASRNEAAFGS